mgnify:CR=1 FL=1
MEMKQISETTLKITISMEDLEERGMELKIFDSTRKDRGVLLLSNGRIRFTR